MTGPPHRWVIHLPVTVPDLVRARIFARTVTRLLAQLTPCVDQGEVTISGADQPAVHHRVFCGRLLPGGTRCTMPTDHTAPCTRRLR